MKNVCTNQLVPLFLVAFLSLGIAACGGGEEEPTPTATKTSIAEAQANETLPTNTPVPEPATTVPTPASSDNPSAADDDAVSPNEQTLATVNTELLNVRSGPSTNNEIVRVINQGEEYAVVSRSDDGAWAELAENDQSIGWVAAQFLAGSDDLAGASSPSGSTPAQPQSATNTAPILSGTMNSPDFGAQAFLWWRAEIADRDITLMQEAGFNWVKQSFAWETIEGAGKGQFDWSISDRVVQQVNGKGLKLLARLSSDPEKQNFWPGHPPGNTANFADFAFALASRYNCTPQAVGCIHAYQVWNEPNLAREWGFKRPNPAEYVEFLRQAYAAIKRGNPSAIVVSAGMAPTGDNNDLAMPDDLFYETMYQAMGGNSNGYFDMLGVHGAGFAAPPELDPATAVAESRYGSYRFFAFRHVEDIRNIMVRNGDQNKKIVLLEFGWTYDRINPNYKWHGADAGIDEFVQADYLKRAYQYAAANWQPWIGLMSLITMPNLAWTDDGNPQDEEQYWWAIMEPSTVDQLYFRPAFVELCIYFRGVQGAQCKYDPN